MDEITVEFGELMKKYRKLENRSEYENIKPDITNYQYLRAFFWVPITWGSPIFKTGAHRGNLSLEQIRLLGLNDFYKTGCTLTFRGKNAQKIRNMNILQ